MDYVLWDVIWSLGEISLYISEWWLCLFSWLIANSHTSEEKWINYNIYDNTLWRVFPLACRSLFTYFYCLRQCKRCWSNDVKHSQVDNKLRLCPAHLAILQEWVRNDAYVHAFNQSNRVECNLFQQFQIKRRSFILL